MVNIVLYSTSYTVTYFISDDVQEAYNLIKDLESTTPQVRESLLRCF